MHSRKSHSAHHEALDRRLSSLDGAPYGAYKSLRGPHALPYLGATLHIDRIQADPYAPPSHLRLEIPLDRLEVDAEMWAASGPARTAILDTVNRRVANELRRSRELFIDRPGQQVLPRTAVNTTLAADGTPSLSLRFEAQMPARGRRILGRAARTLLCEELLDRIDDALFGTPHGHTLQAELSAAVELAEDQAALRRHIEDAGLLAFVADGAILPRRSGNSDEPLGSEETPGTAVAFRSPDSLRTNVTLPSGRTLTGMGIPRGVSVIVGGGFHGKSTLLSALIRGVYNHVAGDGREFVVTDPSAVALRAEDGRAITDVNISPFINGLPSGHPTDRFSTANASGSTSQAAGLMEALEAGTTALLIDEDTSATNFMIRDERMRTLVPEDREPITPLVDRVRELHDRHGVSTVIVAGGSGAFLDVADTVIALDAYRPRDVSAAARELAIAHPGAPEAPFQAHRRTPVARIHKTPRARGLERIQVDREDIDLRAVAQIVDPSQTEAIARLLGRVLQRSGSGVNILALAREEWEAVANEATGLDGLGRNGGEHPGRLALPRFHELMAALNRYRDWT